MTRSEATMADGFPDLTVSEYKRRCSMWANSFDPHYRTMLYVMSSNANKDGAARYHSIEAIQREMRIALNRQDIRRPWIPGYSTIKKYLAELRALGILTSVQTSFRGDNGRWQWGANEYRFNFDRIAVKGHVVRFDFLAGIPLGEAAESRPTAVVANAAAVPEPDAEFDSGMAPGEPPKSHLGSPAVA